MAALWGPKWGAGGGSAVGSEGAETLTPRPQPRSSAPGRAAASARRRKGRSGPRHACGAARGAAAAAGGHPAGVPGALSPPPPSPSSPFAVRPPSPSLRPQPHFAERLRLFERLKADREQRDGGGHGSGPAEGTPIRIALPGGRVLPGLALRSTPRHVAEQLGYGPAPPPPFSAAPFASQRPALSPQAPLGGGGAGERGAAGPGAAPGERRRVGAARLHRSGGPRRECHRARPPPCAPRVPAAPFVPPQRPSALPAAFNQ